MKSNRPKATGQCYDCGNDIDRLDPRAIYCWSCAENRKAMMSKSARIVRAAILRGELPPLSSTKCVDCGADGECYDHRDYSELLVVEPVCRGCNIRRGPAKMPEAA